MDLLYPYIPKWVQSATALRSYDLIKTCRTWKFWFFAKNRRKLKKIQNFAIKVLNIRISQVFFWLMQKENGNSNMFCKFQHHSMHIFFKMAKKCFLKTEKVTTTPAPSDFDGLPYPRIRWYPFFFLKMTAKDVKEITYMPLETFFSVLEQPGKTVRGVATNLPLVRRGLRGYLHP